MTGYKSTINGKAAMMPRDFECPNCGHVVSGFEGDEPTCNNCPRPMTNRIAGATVQMYYEMQPVFTPKNNSQRARVND